MAKQPKRNEVPAAKPEVAVKKVKEFEVLPIYKRPTDIVYSFVYLAFFASAVFSLYAGCRGEGVKLRKFFDPVCSHASKVNLDLPLDLHKKWNKDIGVASNEFMHLVYCAVNIFFGLPLALVMFFGAKYNNWQKCGILHGAVLFVVNGYALAEGWEAKQAQRDVFEAAYMCLALIPIMFVYRWWGDNCFTNDSFRGSYFVNMLINLYSILALSFVLIIVYEWAITAHPTLKGFQRVQPFVEQYQKVAVASVTQFGETVLAKTNELIEQYSK